VLRPVAWFSVGTDGTYQAAQSTFLESDNSQSMTAVSPTLRTTGVGLGEFPVTSPEALLQGGSFFERKWTRARSFTARHVRPPPHTGTRNKESSNYGGMCEPCIYVSFTQPSGALSGHTVSPSLGILKRPTCSFRSMLRYAGRGHVLRACGYPTRTQSGIALAV
jgi:hypothetical protein